MQLALLASCTVQSLEDLKAATSLRTAQGRGRLWVKTAACLKATGQLVTCPPQNMLSVWAYN